MHLLQNAFESNWYGAGSTRVRKKKRTKKPAKETVVVVDDEDNEGQGQGEEKSKVPMLLDRALAKAFTYNSTNPNIAVSMSALAPGPAVASGSTRRLQKKTCVESLSDSRSMEVVITSLMKCSHVQTASNQNHNHWAVLPCVSPCRKRKQQHLYTLTSPPRKQQHIICGGDPSDECRQDGPDEEVEIVVDAPWHALKPKLQSQPEHMPCRVSPVTGSQRSVLRSALSTSVPVFALQPRRI